jgi:hypothetical protein
VRLFEPSNLLNLQPTLGADLAKSVKANVAWNALWRENQADAFYAPRWCP